MNGPERLTEHLASLAAERGFAQVWKTDTLRLENGDGTAGTVISFPVGFWERFDEVDDDMRANALDSIRLSVAVEYRPHAGPMAHVIDAHMSYLYPAD
jgi:hypothetical protein